MPIEPEMVTIPKREYDSFLKAQKLLDCFYAAGVDNWDGYDEAQEMFDEHTN